MNGSSEEREEYLKPDWKRDTDRPRVHDWRRWISTGVQELWETFTDEQKIAIGEMAQDLADNEDWD